MRTLTNDHLERGEARDIVSDIEASREQVPAVLAANKQLAGGERRGNSRKPAQCVGAEVEEAAPAGNSRQSEAEEDQR